MTIDINSLETDFNHSLNKDQKNLNKILCQAEEAVKLARHNFQEALSESQKKLHNQIKDIIQQSKKEQELARRQLKEAQLQIITAKKVLAKT